MSIFDNQSINQSIYCSIRTAVIMTNYGRELNRWMIDLLALVTMNKDGGKWRFSYNDKSMNENFSMKLKI